MTFHPSSGSTGAPSSAQSLGNFCWLLCLAAILLGLLLPGLVSALGADEFSAAVLSRLPMARAGLGLTALVYAVAGLLLRVLPRCVTQREAFANAFLAGAVLLFVLTAAELVLSVKYSAWYVSWDPFGENQEAIAVRDPSFGHVLIRGLSQPYKINPQGFRGPVVSSLRGARELRIVTVGDSITFGWNLFDDDATYPRQLERLLSGARRDGTKYYVINLGVPGYASLQTLKVTADRIPELQPDLVILCVGWNDLSFGYRRDWHPAIALDEGRFSPAILRAARDWGSRLSRRRPAERAPATDAEPNPAAVEAFRVNLLRTVAILRARGVGLVILNIPTVLSARMTPEERDKARLFPRVDHLTLFQRQIDDTCRLTATPCVLNILDLEATAKGRYFQDHCHPTREGNEVIARKVFVFLRESPRFSWLWGEEGQPARFRRKFPTPIGTSR